jgi:CDP-glucose 4,6-dehydratase
MLDYEFFKGKNVLITGHTGFKGSWLSRMLIDAGANLTGYSLAATMGHSLFALSNIESNMHSIIADIRDADNLFNTFSITKPEIVFHLAAQPLVLVGYQSPRETFETNVMGTVNILECVRRSDSVRSFLNVTTDKVYYNPNNSTQQFSENDPLDGFDPYSNSKSCSELITHSYQSSFFADGRCAISTARAGNVIGGGDFSENRIVPDCVRAAIKGEPVILRNSKSVRPYQHVLEPLAAYLLIVCRQWHEPSLASWYNVGPENDDCITTGELASLFCAAWGQGLTWAEQCCQWPHESGYLRLDSTKLKTSLGWKPRWDIRKAVEKTVEWTRAWLQGYPVEDLMRSQIRSYGGDDK